MRNTFDTNPLNLNVIVYCLHFFFFFFLFPQNAFFESQKINANFFCLVANFRTCTLDRKFIEKQSMVKQPPAALKSVTNTTSSSSTSATHHQSSSSTSNISSTHKTANLSTTSNKKKYGGSQASPNRSRSATKELILPPNDSASSAPTFTTGLKNLAIGDGERLTFQCQVAGDPEPQVSWYKDGKKLESNDFVDLKYKYGLATLKIEKVYPEDAGEYKCIAKNYVNQAESVATLKVKRECCKVLYILTSPTQFILTHVTHFYYLLAMEGGHTGKRKVKTGDEALSDKAPKVTKHLSSTYVQDGGECELVCEIGDTSIYDVVWLHNNKEIKPSADFNYVKEKNSLKLKIAEIFPEGEH